jgi:hypothetical protein
MRKISAQSFIHAGIKLFLMTTRMKYRVEAALMIFKNCRENC